MAYATGFIVFIVLLAIWSIIWKGLALWRAAQNKQKAWYIVMLIINTAGILEILYLYIISPKKKKK